MADSPVIIVTGAGSGIGRAACILLAAEGAKLTLVGRSESNLHETARLMRDRKSINPPLVIAADISHQVECVAVVRASLKQWGRVDALINNAGMVQPRPIDHVDEDALRELFGVNTFGPAYLIAACWGNFVQQRGGRIMNVSSMSTIDPFPGLAMYAAAKSALESYTRSIAAEGTPHNILGFTIVLGAVETQMLRQVVSPELFPPSRALDPNEAARIIVDCAMGKRDEDAAQPLIVRKQ